MRLHHSRGNDDGQGKRREGEREAVFGFGFPLLWIIIAWKLIECRTFSFDLFLRLPLWTKGGIFEYSTLKKKREATNCSNNRHGAKLIITPRDNLSMTTTAVHPLQTM